MAEVARREAQLAHLEEQRWREEEARREEFERIEVQRRAEEAAHHQQLLGAQRELAEANPNPNPQP